VQSAQSREMAPVSTQRAEGLVSQATSVRLDVDVDWSKVPMADNPAPLAVAAYER
jgi:hypothetical protein